MTTDRSEKAKILREKRKRALLTYIVRKPYQESSYTLSKIFKNRKYVRMGDKTVRDLLQELITQNKIGYIEKTDNNRYKKVYYIINQEKLQQIEKSLNYEESEFLKLIPADKPIKQTLLQSKSLFRDDKIFNILRKLLELNFIMDNGETVFYRREYIKIKTD